MLEIVSVVTVNIYFLCFVLDLGSGNLILHNDNTDETGRTICASFLSSFEPGKEIEYHVMLCRPSSFIVESEVQKHKEIIWSCLETWMHICKFWAKISIAFYCFHFSFVQMNFFTAIKPESLVIFDVSMFILNIWIGV